MNYEQNVYCSRFEMLLLPDIYSKLKYYTGANQNGIPPSNGQDRASSGSSGISSLKNQIAKSFRLSSSSASVSSSTAPQRSNSVQSNSNECSTTQDSKTWNYVTLKRNKIKDIIAILKVLLSIFLVAVHLTDFRQFRVTSER